MIAFLENYLFYMIIAAAILVFLRIITLPIKWIFKLLWSAFAGFLLLVLVNVLGSFVGITIGINLLTSLVAGILGIPGVILLLLLKWLFGAQ